MGRFALSLGGEVKEHLLQAGAVSRTELDDRYSGGEHDLPEQFDLGSRQQSIDADP